MRKILITGGAGYIGSVLASELISRGHAVTVVDDLLFGGESILPLLHFDAFRFIKRDITGEGALDGLLEGVECVVHLAAIIGFPACAKADRELVWRTNVEATRMVYEAAARAGVCRLIFASSYSNYGESLTGEPVTEQSPLHPKSLYAESKISAEQYLLARCDGEATAPTCLRLATVFGLSPRTRFDLIVNQFVMEAFIRGRIELFQEEFLRSFVHVRDVVRAMGAVMDAPLGQVRNQVFNVGSEGLNTSKRELALMIQRQLPQVGIKYRDTAFAGDMQSLGVSFQKIRETLQFETKYSLDDGIEELVRALSQGVISDPTSTKHYNHPPIMA